MSELFNDLLRDNGIVITNLEELVQSLSGVATSIQGVEVADLTGIQDGNTLVYDQDTQSFIPVSVELDDGSIKGITVSDLSNIQDGNTLVYDQNTQSFVPVSVSVSLEQSPFDAFVSLDFGASNPLPSEVTYTTDPGKYYLGPSLLAGLQDTPRYVWGGESGSSRLSFLGLEMTPTYTSLLLNSQELTTGWTTVEANVSLVTEFDYQGIPVYAISATTSNSAHTLRNPSPPEEEGIYTASIFVKPKDYRRISLVAIHTDDVVSSSTLILVNLDTLVVTTPEGRQALRAGVNPLSGGWFRVWLTYYITDAATSHETRVQLLANSLTFEGDPNDEIYVTAAQVTETPSLMPYVPTTSSTVTVNSDNLSIPVADSFSDGISFVLSLKGDDAEDGWLFTLRDTGTSRHVRGRVDSEVLYFTADYDSGEPVLSTQGSFEMDIKDVHHIGVSVTKDEVYVAINGQSHAMGIAFPDLYELAVLDIGPSSFDWGVLAYHKRLAIYPHALTAGELEGLTET